MHTRTTTRHRRRITIPQLKTKLLLAGPGSIVNRAIVCSDDDPDILKGLGTCLEADGFVNVHLAERADETMRLVRAVRPSLLITDMLKPGLNGQDMARILKADPELRHMLVLLFSGVHEQYPWDRSVFCGFIQKPCRIKPFIEVIRLLLGFGANAWRGAGRHDNVLN